MQLKYLKTLLPSQDTVAKIGSMAWSPNNAKLAVCNADRVVILFDEQGERRDKFSTKPVDAKYGKKSYVVKGIAFSPDSTKIAIAQSDNILFVYKIGEDWADKKVICNKFAQQSAVTCLIWPTEHNIVFGLADGKVRLANVKTNKSSTLYNTDVYVCTLAVSPNNKGFLSSHSDGSIVRFFFDHGGNGEAEGKICTHPSPAYALVWTPNAIVAAGCDKRVISYNRDGRIMQQFDYSRDENEREFTTAVLNPSGQSIVIGSYDRMRLFDWNTRKGAWEEGKVLDIQFMYTISALAWKPDGTRIVAGALCGNVEMFDCSLKRSVISNKFETTHVGPSQVIVKHLASGKRAIVRSDMGFEIEDVKVLGKDRYVVARTSDSLLLADLETGKASEVHWQSGGNDKFYFDCDNVCIVFNAGELSLVEYGNNEIVGSVRTDFMKPQLISVRISERKHKGQDQVKRMAYLVDLKTICIMDLMYGSTAGQVMHDSKIDWLELNETARRLLFRDKRLRLFCYNIENENKITLLGYCTFVQWVPGSDVVVAQSRDNLCVWYNIDAPERVSMFPIKGEVVELIREQGRTEVIVNEGVTHASYTLDEGLIEFGTAMEDGDLGRAVSFLETLELTPESEAMWQQLAHEALEKRQLLIAQRAYAALGDVSRARYLQNIINIAKEYSKQTGGDGNQCYKVRAKLAIMNKQFKEAERIYLEQNSMDEAIEMYQSLHKWDDALEFAQSRNHPDVENLKSKYYRHLNETGQDEKAAELKEKEGDSMAAIDIYLKSNMPARAAKVVIEHENLLNNSELVQTIAMTLIKSELYERAGDLFEKVKDFDRALQCFRRAQAFNRAIELARYAFPQEVVKLEEEWADSLVEQKQMDAAISHYIESGNTTKALEAAVRARQWNRAVQIVEVLENPETAKQYYGKIAEHYASVGEYDRAERFFIEAGLHKQAVEMYNAAEKWQDAHRVSSEFLKEDESNEMYMKQAETLEKQGKYREAEKLYLAINQPQRAIVMYKTAGQNEQMMRLVKQHYGEQAQDTHAHLAKEMEEKGRLREAEQHYIEAGEWKSAVNMYRTAEQWDDAYRVAKQCGGDMAPKQVAYMWAKHLGGDSAVKLLQKFGLLEETIDYASDNGAIDFAFELCRLGMKAKMPAVHAKYAAQLEDEGQWAHAEEQFMLAGKPKEAVLMYVHQQDWDNAQRIAEKHCPEEVTEIYIAQAAVAFKQKDFQKAESFLLRVQKPGLIVESYKELGMWTEALRICKEYLPNLLPKLQDEYDNQQLKSGAKGVQSYLAQAKDWENQGEYERAIACYMKVTRPVTDDEAMMEKCWKKAGDLALKFVENNKVEIVKQIAFQLAEIKKYDPAAELYLSVELVQEAVDCLIAGVEWNKARKVAAEYQTELVEYVDDKYKTYLRSEGKAEQLADLDVLSAIEMLIEKNQWDKVLETAQQQKNASLLDKYVALYATEMIKEKELQKAVDAFCKYGASANQQNFNIYKRLIDETIGARGNDTPEAYKTWATLRNMLVDLVKRLKTSKEAFDPRYSEIFDKYLLITHYYALRSALMNITENDMQLCATKISISLLRWTDLISADKAFYEAGMAAKKFGGRYESMAFVFLNHYLDLADAIEDQNPDAVDYSDFEGTDIPVEHPLPEALHLSPEQHDEVKEWVLAVSVDKQLDRMLLTDKRNIYEACLQNPDGTVAEACIVTGYPVLDNKKTFESSGKVANKEDWNKLLMAQKMAKLSELDDVMTFLGKWTETPISLSF